MRQPFKWNSGAPGWAFMWVHEQPYVTSIFNWSRRAVIDDVEKMMGCKWRKTYRRGGRVIKVHIAADEGR